MSARLRLALLPLAAALALAAPRARADETPSPIDGVEDRALREETHAKYEEALKSFEEAFSMSVREAAKSDAKTASRDRARAEVYLEKMEDLTNRLSGFRETEEFLRGFKSEELGPVLKGWVDWNRAGYLRRSGKVEESRKAIESLGLVTTWWILGPFDNQEGRGFSAKSGPEEEKGVLIDLAKSYRGKERQVAWRRVPAAHPYGWVDLDAMLRPNDQCLAYAVTWLRADEERTVALRFASDQGIAAWVNGTEMLRRDVHRRGGFDQDTVGVKLRKGWNRVLLKVSEETGAWGFRMRATTPEGEPILDLGLPATDAEVAEAVGATKDDVAAEKAPAVRGALDALADAAPLGKTSEDGSADARAYFWLGLLHRARQYDDMKSEMPDRKFLDRAAKLRPEDPVYVMHAAEAATRPIDMDVEKLENDQRRGREKALKLDPGYAEAYQALAVYYTDSLRNLPRAEEMCRKALAANEHYLEAWLLLARIVDRRGFATEAELVLRDVLARPEFATRTRFLHAVADKAGREGLLQAARDTYRKSLTADLEDAGARDRLASVLVQEGLADDAVGVFDERLRLNPFDLDAARRKAEFLEGLARLPEAAATAAGGLEVSPEDENLLRVHGRILARLEKKGDAVAKWKEALRVNPKNTVLKRYVEWLDPSLRPFELPYVEDTGALLAGVRGLEDANKENDPFMVVLDKTVTRVNPDGTSNVFTQKVVKILNNMGAKQNPSYRAGSFWAEEQAFKWRTARVWRKDGTVEEAQVQGGQSWVRWPQLKPGDAFEVQHRVDELKQSFFGDYFGDRQMFADRVPVKRAEYVLLTPAAREFQFHTRNMPEGAADPVSIQDEGKTKLYAWRLRDRPKVRMEPLMPSWEESQPLVEVSSFKDWNAFSTWWWNLIKRQFIANDKMKAKVAELTKDAATREDKVRAIYNFVVTDIQYQAWEFGVHGYKPYTAEQIFERAWGDCKDKAILIKTMLQEVGIEAFPVLIMAQQIGRIDQDMTLAQVGHFNHCIAYVPDVDGKGKAMFLDGTAQYNSMDSVPSMDRGAKVLLVRPEGGEIVQIPWNRPEELSLGQEFAVTLKEDGAAAVAGKFHYVGDLAVQARAGFSVEGKRPEELKKMLGAAFGEFTLGETSFPNLKDITSPVVDIGVDFQAARLGKVEGNRMSVPMKSTMDFAGQLGMLASLKEREHDLVFINPLLFTAKWVFTPPEGWKVAKLPAGRSVESPIGAFLVTVKEEGGKVVVERTVRLDTNRITKEQYGKFREMVSTANSSSSEKLVLERTAAPADGGAAAVPAPAAPAGEGDKK